MSGMKTQKIREQEGTLGYPCGCGAYPMQVGVGILRHVIVEGNVHPLNIHASAK